jgi:hypothetical protein
MAKGFYAMTGPGATPAATSLARIPRATDTLRRGSGRSIHPARYYLCKILHLIYFVNIDNGLQVDEYLTIDGLFSWSPM